MSRQQTPPDNKLTPRSGNNLAPAGKQSILRFKGKWAVVASMVAAGSAQLSQFFNFGVRILEKLDLAEFTSTTFLGWLFWLFSPRGAQALFLLFFLLMLIAIYRTLFSQESPPSPGETAENIPSADVKELEGRINELERESAALEKAREDASTLYEKARRDNDVLQGALAGKISDLESLEWLRNVADDQLKNLRKYVLVRKCDINLSPLSDGKRYVEFTFHVINYSVLHVTIPMRKDAVIEGSIYFGGDRLSGEAKLVENRVIGLPPYGTTYFKIHQWVSSDDVKDIPETFKTVGNLFGFSEAVVYVRADEFPDDKAARLDLTSGMQNADLENQIIQLENEIAAWRRHSGTIEQLQHALGGAYVLYRMFEAGEPPSRARIENWFDSTLRGHIHPNIVAAINEGMPELTDSPAEQKEYVDRYCFKLRRIIEEQR